MSLQTLQSMVQLKLLAETFDVIKLAPPQLFPAWIAQSAFFFVSQTDDEYSIICVKAAVPAAVQSATAWRCFKVDGDIAPEQPGVAASVAKPMADAGLSLILVGTHDRDYILVQDDLLSAARDVYRAAGYTLTDA